MKMYRMLCLAAALALPILALAKLPFTNAGFGQVEGILDFCAHGDAQNAPKYQEQKKSLANEVPEKEVEEARKTQEYRDGYDSTTDELAKAPKEQAVMSCTNFLKGK